ncbi:MAG: DUF4411 family protein [Verrucomicrobia bacterium]|nr:DUF4411 family protein [Verrucomicrobiota bacterium]
MDWQARYYPLDVFATLNTRIEQLVKSGDFRAVELVKDEINAIGTPDLKTWAGNHKNLFAPLTPDVQLEAAAIEAKYPDLTDPKSPYQSADAYVIAFAKLQNGVVVSQETSVHEKRNPAKKHYIPDVCRDLGVPCINLLGLMRKEHWKF